MSLAEVTERLLARSGRGAKYGLERIEAALETLGHPERSLRVVHVAGTNGKGSVCSFLDAMARAAELEVGTFTSPHLCRLNERIRLGGEPIDDDRFTFALDAALGAEPPVTFFEAVTIAGFVAMQRAEVDLAVFEVGLGGRLDATNVIPPPACAVITSIGLDHTRLLGDTVEAIAKEKAGIIKAGSPVVIGSMAPAARDAILDVTTRRGSGPVTAVVPLGDDTHLTPSWHRAGATPLHFERFDAGLRLTGAFELTLPKVALAGAHQDANAAAAAAAMMHMGPALDRPDPTAAIARGAATANWPGRFEVFERDGKRIVLDCAHNEHAARALVSTLERTFGDVPSSRMHLVFGALGDKQWAEMLRHVGPRADHRHYCTPLAELAGRKPAMPSDLAALLPGATHASKADAIDAALRGAAAGDTVLVTGSIFLVGAVRLHLLGESGDVPVPL